MNSFRSAETPDAFVVRRADSGTNVLLELTGELDVSGVDRLNEATRHLKADNHVTIDLSELAFMDSAGIRVLMGLDLRSRSERWTLVLHAPQPQVLSILTLCGFVDRFEITA